MTSLTAHKSLFDPRDTPADEPGDIALREARRGNRCIVCLQEFGGRINRYGGSTVHDGSGGGNARLACSFEQSVVFVCHTCATAILHKHGTLPCQWDFHPSIRKPR